MTNDAFEVDGAERQGRWLVTCDHASNAVPDWVNGGDLGMPPEDMKRHIAYDVGAAGVSKALAKLLDSPAILSCYSRMVLDPNRGADDPTLLRKLYDGSIIPANRSADRAEFDKRMAKLYHPYHDELEALAQKRDDTVICAVHSFTPQLRGRSKRPWEIGVLYARDDRLALPFMEECRAARWCVGDNEPYNGDLPGDSIDQHALKQGRLNVLIEVRNDLIETKENQVFWAEQLAPMLQRALTKTGL